MIVTERAGRRPGRSRRANRLRGYVCYVGTSRSAIFWAIIKAESKREFFAYGRCFLSFPNIPRVGWQAEFVALPPLPGHKLSRATEIRVFSGNAEKSTP